METWSAIFKDAPVGIVIIDGTDQVVRYVNPAFCRLIERSQEELIGRGIAQTLPANIVRGFTVLVGEPRATSAGAPTMPANLPWPAVAWSPNGDQHAGGVTIIEVLFDTVLRPEYETALEEIRAINGALVVSNVRTQELLDEAEQTSLAKDNFLAMLGHELRNPLAPIRNAVEILKHAQASDPTVVQARDMIARQISNMAQLVDELLDVSRLEHGKISLRKSRLDLVDMVREIVHDYRPNFDAAHLTVEMTSGAEPLWVIGDRTRLEQVVGNILSNAIKFTPRGGHVYVQLTAQADFAVIVIRDTGAGMEPQMLRDAFELFRQADNTLSRSRGGLGVGLSLAKALVQLHQGEIHAASDGLGKGSEFTIRLPLTHAPATDTPAASLAPEQAPAARVLIVEDNVDAAESMRLLLSLDGHAVAVTHTGTDALLAARDFHPDVVLCDIGLPGDMDGYAVARAIRDDPGVPTPRMIAISGYGQQHDVMLAHQAGFDQHLTKPVEPERLYELLRMDGKRG